MAPRRGHGASWANDAWRWFWTTYSRKMHRKMRRRKQLGSGEDGWRGTLCVRNCHRLNMTKDQQIPSSCSWPVIYCTCMGALFSLSSCSVDAKINAQHVRQMFVCEWDQQLNDQEVIIQINDNYDIYIYYVYIWHVTCVYAHTNFAIYIDSMHFIYKVNYTHMADTSCYNVDSIGSISIHAALQLQEFPTFCTDWGQFPGVLSRLQPLGEKMLLIWKDWI